LGVTETDISVFFFLNGNWGVLLVRNSKNQRKIAPGAHDSELLPKRQSIMGPSTMNMYQAHGCSAPDIAAREMQSTL
jgi:hypothetical protein